MQFLSGVNLFWSYLFIFAFVFFIRNFEPLDELGDVRFSFNGPVTLRQLKDGCERGQYLVCGVDRRHLCPYSRSRFHGLDF
jgi:hypothetical protein